MGFIASSFSNASSRERARDAIVVLQWENSVTALSPRLRFWIIRFPVPSKGAPKTRETSFPVPTAVEKQIDEISSISFGANRRLGRLQLPPQVLYQSSSRSVLVHNLLVGESQTDSELLSWGPGLRLRKVQITDGFFDEPLASLSDTKFLSHSTIQGGSQDLRAGHKLDLDGLKEQIVRTASVLNSAVSSAISGSSVPLHRLTVGSTAYTVLINLGRSEDGSNTKVSLYTTLESDFKAEAQSVKETRDDLGLRWEVQNFHLPSGVTNVAPVVVKCYEKPYPTYLVLFYTYQGAMYYSHLRYAGSGYFGNQVIGVPCLLAPEPEDQQVAPAPKASAPSRWSISAISRPSPKLPDAGETPSEQVKQEPISTALQGFQPTVIQADGNLWLFYEGPDGNPRYAACSYLPKEIKDLGVGWEEVSWSAEPLLSSESSEGTDDKAAPISRHFLPVVVPRDFMNIA
ncbi:unnamed protein product [Clonostachys rosea f. rosea IK726]|uniref:Uncharacterized protein n=1 Tax=Clonostachys rosea f. rosea IK726 TaxID=1349383 RepID=A0ACA9U4F0_BIOOC|nr:unnamed protein product [Clonostachys rosea f. rosea IK726]